MLARENPVAQNQRQQEAYSNDVTCGGSVTRIPGRAQTRVALSERARSSIFAEQNRADNFAPSARCPRHTAQGSQNWSTRFQAHAQQHFAGRGSANRGATSAAPFKCFYHIGSLRARHRRFSSRRNGTGPIGTFRYSTDLRHFQSAVNSKLLVGAVGVGPRTFGLKRGGCSTEFCPSMV